MPEHYDKAVSYAKPLKPYFTRYGRDGQQWAISWHEDELEAADNWHNDRCGEEVKQLFQVTEVEVYTDQGYFCCAIQELELPFVPNVRLKDNLLDFIN